MSVFFEHISTERTIPIFHPLPIFGWKTEFLSITYNRNPPKTDHPLFMPETT